MSFVSKCHRYQGRTLSIDVYFASRMSLKDENNWSSKKCRIRKKNCIPVIAGQAFIVQLSYFIPNKRILEFETRGFKGYVLSRQKTIMVVFVLTSEYSYYWKITSQWRAFKFHVEIFSVWTSRRQVQKQRRMKEEKWKGQLSLVTSKHIWNIALFNKCHFYFGKWPCNFQSQLKWPSFGNQLLNFSGNGYVNIYIIYRYLCIYSNIR